MFIGFIIALVIYYSLLAVWYLSRKEYPSSLSVKKPQISSKESQIIGESSYRKRKETQINANATTNEKTVENEYIFVAETDTEPVIPVSLDEEKKEDSSIVVIPLEKLDKVFSTQRDDDVEDQDTEEDVADSIDIPGDPNQEPYREFDEDVTGKFDYEVEEESEPDVDWEEEEQRLRAYQAEDDGDLNLASGVSFEELERLDIILSQPENPVEEIAEAGTILNKIAGTELFEHVISALPEALDRISRQIEKQVAISRTEKQQMPEWMNFDINNYI